MSDAWSDLTSQKTFVREIAEDKGDEEAVASSSTTQ